MKARMKIYIDPADWWVGYYRGPHRHYVCVLPCVVISWGRRGVPPAITEEQFRRSWENAVLQGFLQMAPATGEMPDYMHALSTAMLDVRPWREP